MAELLSIHNWDHMLKGPNRTPWALMQLPVDPKNAPFLVSNRNGIEPSVLWIHKAGKNGKVNCCPREDSKIRTEIIKEIVATGEEKEVGNVHPLTKEGVEAALAYLKTYEIDDCEALVAKDVEETFLSDEMNAYVKEWVPEGHLVLVPRDRTYLGDMGMMSTGHVVVVIHNPLRGMAIAKR